MYLITLDVGNVVLLQPDVSGIFLGNVHLNKYPQLVSNTRSGRGMRCDEAPYYRSVSSKGAGRPRLTLHHKGGWNGMKWMRWVWRNGGMKFCGMGKWEKPREKPTQTPFCPPRNPHGVTETRTRDPSGGKRAPNRLPHEAAYAKLSRLGLHYKSSKPVRGILTHPVY